MMWTHPTSFGTLALVVCLSLPAGAWAQSSDTRTDGRRKSGTYLQTGIAHGQADIFKRGSLTQWDVDLFGTNYDLVSAKLEFESYFGDTLLQLSGFSIGYRKDGLRRAESGHMFSGSVFRDFDVKVFAVKVGGGVEWGEGGEFVRIRSIARSSCRGSRNHPRSSRDGVREMCC